MRHPKFYQYALLTNLIFCGGLFIPVVGHTNDRHYRYLPYDIFQAPAFFIKSIIRWKFQDAEILATWNSYSLVGPLLNLISSSIWVFVVFTILKIFRLGAKSDNRANIYWRKVYRLNLFSSVVLFILWLPMTDLFIRGVTDSPFTDVYFSFLFPFELFGSITMQIGSVFLESGGDTAYGFSDTKLLLSLASSFGMTTIFLVVILLKRWIIRRKPVINISLL